MITERKSNNRKNIIILILLIFIALAASIAALVRWNSFSLVLNIPEEETIQVGLGDEYEAPEVLASVKGIYFLTEGIEIPDAVAKSGQVDTETIGVYTEEYSAKFLWMETSAVRIVEVEDMTAPEITLQGDSEIEITQGDTWEDPGCLAEDNADGDLSQIVLVSGEVDTNIVGNYTLTYTVEDAAGHTASVTRIVVVNPKPIDPANPGDKVIYLTFDDGPGPYTQQLLDVLDKYGVKVTFFVTNQFPPYIDLIKEEFDRGHTVAIHTYTHQYQKIYQSEEAFYSDISKMSTVIEEQTGVKPTILRFPGGTSNGVSKKYCKGIMTALSQSVGDHGYVYCDWNVDSNDAGGASSTEEVVNNVIAGIKKHNVSHVLQHDIQSFSVDGVEQIIQWGLENGYTFLPLTDESPMCHHPVNN